MNANQTKTTPRARAARKSAKATANNCFSIPADIFDEVAELAAKEGVSVDEWASEAVIQFLTKPQGGGICRTKEEVCATLRRQAATGKKAVELLAIIEG